MCVFTPELLLVLIVPTREGWTGWVDLCGWLCTKMVYSLTQSPIQVLTGPGVVQLRWSRPRRCHWSKRHLLSFVVAPVEPPQPSTMPAAEPPVYPRAAKPSTDVAKQSTDVSRPQARKPAAVIPPRPPPKARVCYLSVNINIQHDTAYVTCSKKLTHSQLSLPHGMNKKYNRTKTKNKLMSMIRLVQSHYHEGSPMSKE